MSTLPEQPESDEDDGESWFDSAFETWTWVMVMGATFVVPIVFWIAHKFFGWEPPEFVQSIIEFFSA